MSEIKVIKNKKIFNINGPCNPNEHYMLPALTRQAEVPQLIEDKQYFVLHAPRQSGKTTFINAIIKEINEGGQYYALYCSLNTLTNVEDNNTMAKSVVNQLRIAASELKNTRQAWSPALVELPDSYIRETLSNLCKALDKPLVLFFDEADSLSDNPLIIFLTQLRDGFNRRSINPFPRSIALIGLVNLRDYKAKVRPDSETVGSPSPFNMATVLTLNNFTRDEIGHLYSQHTELTGQIFDSNSIDRAWYWTDGQPWLVNALAKQVVEKDLKYDYSKTIVAAHIDIAAETIKLSRETHIDSLLNKLKEPRVQKVIAPMLYGGDPIVDLLDDDTSYCTDLGLIKKSKTGSLSPSNPIYADSIVRILTYTIQTKMSDSYTNRWLDGKNIDMNGLLKAFQAYWQNDSEPFTATHHYKEAAPHLILQTFFQKVVNGGAQIFREYATGRKRVDLCLKYAEKNYPVEIKLAGAGSKKNMLNQILGYIDTCGTKEGWLVIFDRDKNKSWENKITWETETLDNGKTVHVVGC